MMKAHRVCQEAFRGPINPIFHFFKTLLCEESTQHLSNLIPVVEHGGSIMLWDMEEVGVEGKMNGAILFMKT